MRGGIGVDIGNLLCDAAGAIGRHSRGLEKKERWVLCERRRVRSEIRSEGGEKEADMLKGE